MLVRSSLTHNAQFIHTHTHNPAFVAREARDAVLELATAGAFTWIRPDLGQEERMGKEQETDQAARMARRPS